MIHKRREKDMSLADLGVAIIGCAAWGLVVLSIERFVNWQVSHERRGC